MLFYIGLILSTEYYLREIAGSLPSLPRHTEIVWARLFPGILFLDIKTYVTMSRSSPVNSTFFDMILKYTLPDFLILIGAYLHWCHCYGVPSI